MAESVEKMQKAETAGFWGKIFSWVAVALTVVVAVAASVATGGLAAGPCIAAAVAVTMLVLSETGAMDKLTELVAKGLEACGMSKDDAKKWSQWIMVGVGIAISLVTLCAGIASAFGTSASAAARASAQAATAAARTSLQLAAEAAQKIAQMVSAMVTIAQQTASVTGAVFSYEAGNIQADTADIKAYLAKLQQILEDESELLQSLVQDMSNAFSKALQIMSGQAEQQAETIQHMA